MVILVSTCRDFEQFYDTACMAMQDLKSFRKPNIVSVPLLTKEDPEKSSLGVLLVMLKTSTDKFVLASDSDNESEALEMREKCRDLVEENLDSKASLEMHASDYDHLVCLAQDIADIGHNYLQNIIYNAMAPLMPSSKHGWGNAGGLIVDPRFRNSGLKAFSINPSGRKDYVTSSNSDGFLDSSLSSGKTRSGALQSSDFDLPALENACTEQPESEDYGVDTMDYISDTDSEVDLGEMPIPTPAHDEAFDKFLKWRLFFQDPEMEEFYNLWRNEHVSQRDCLLFVLLFLGFIVQFFSQINIAWIGNLNLPFDFPDQKHAEEDLSHFSGSKKLLGFDLAANLSISIYRIFAMLWIYGLGFMESLPKLINLRTIVQVVVPSILFLRLSLNSSGRRRKIYRHVRDFNVNFTFVLVVGAHVFFPMKKNIQGSDLNLYNLVLNNFTGTSSFAFSLESLYSLALQSLNLIRNLFLGKLAVDFDAAVMTAAFLGIVLQLKFYFYLISMIVLLSLHAIIETDFAIIGMGFLSLLPCVCLYLTERWNRRRFLLSPLASDWIW